LLVFEVTTATNARIRILVLVSGTFASQRTITSKDKTTTPASSLQSKGDMNRLARPAHLHLYAVTCQMRALTCLETAIQFHAPPFQHGCQSYKIRFE
jgi:hypothetical protein